MAAPRWRRTAVGLALLVAAVAGLYQSGLVTGVSPQDIEALLQPYGLLAPVFFVLLYVVATVLLLPATPLTVASGALFGFWLGTVYVIVGATVGATLAFLYARFVSTGWSVETRQGFLARLAAFEARLEEHGFATVLVLRLLPIVPFNVINFALGLTGIRLRSYVLATFIGIIPGSATYVYFGHSLSMLTWQSLATAALALIVLTVAGWYGKRMFTRNPSAGSRNL